MTWSQTKKLSDIAGRALALTGACDTECIVRDDGNSSARDELLKEAEEESLAGSRGAHAASSAVDAIAALRGADNFGEHPEHAFGASAVADWRFVRREGSWSRTGRESVNDSSLGNDEAIAALRDTSLWVPREREPAGVWIRRVAKALFAALEQSEEALAIRDFSQSSSKAGRLAAEVALIQAAENAESGGLLHAAVSEGFRSALLHAPAEHARIILLLIERIRQRGLVGFAKRNTEPDPAKKWPKAAWVDIPSDTIAQAALQCEQPSLAALWSELHCAEVGLGEWGAELSAVAIQLGAEDGLQAGGDADRVQALAMARSWDVRAQGQAAARGRRWAEAVGAFDILERLFGMHEGSGRARALRGLGCSLTAMGVEDDGLQEQEWRWLSKAICANGSHAVAHAVREGRQEVISRLCLSPRARESAVSKLHALAVAENAAGAPSIDGVREAWRACAPGSDGSELGRWARIECAGALGGPIERSNEMRHAARMERKLGSPGRALELLREARGPYSIAEDVPLIPGWLEEAKAMRELGQKGTAEHLVKSALVWRSQCEENNDRARALSAAAKWAGRSSRTEEMLEQATQAAANHQRERGRAHFRLAASLEERFRVAEAWLRDQEEEEIQRLAGIEAGAVQEAANKGQGPRQVRGARLRQKAMSEDKKERDTALKSASAALQRSLASYRECLTAGCRAYDTRAAYRLLALFLRATERLPADWQEARESALREGRKALGAPSQGGVGSAQLTQLLPQICSRLGASDTAVSEACFGCCLRLANDLPKQCLTHIYGLMHASSSEGTSKRAGQIWEHLGRQSKASKVAVALEDLMNGYKQLAAESPTTNSGTGTVHHLPVDRRRSREEQPNPSCAPVVTALSRSEDDFPCVIGFGRQYTVAGGNSRPKLLTCFCSDGIARKQILKSSSGEDLRQDAVMQQFCALASELVQWETKGEGGMSMRTYAVAPVASGVGVVECVEATKSLGDYLAKEGHGAHERLRPRDWTPRQCRDRVLRPPGGDKVEAFKECSRKMKPVFRWFFFEHFATPGRWKLARSLHARSAAVASMVGFTLGLGDRHASNVLVDASAGDVVHIDFGVAFDQGRLLPTPERVPFRLTRDVMDGLGPEAPNGPFRSACERCSSLLNKHKHALLTVVEILVHDPLLDWALSPAGAANRQAGSGDCAMRQVGSEQRRESIGDRNAEAEKAVLGVRRKLEGHVDGEPLSPEDQVQRLLGQATDVHRLAHMFPGWQPWL